MLIAYNQNKRKYLSIKNVSQNLCLIFEIIYHFVVVDAVLHNTQLLYPVHIFLWLLLSDTWTSSSIKSQVELGFEQTFSLSLAKEKQFGAALLENFADSSLLYRSLSTILYCLCFPLPLHLMHIYTKEQQKKILKKQHEEVFHLWS